MRASDQERDRAVRLLGEHAALGRLTLAELEERVSAALVARTHGELAALTRDLPPLAGWSPSWAALTAAGGSGCRVL